MMAKKAPPRSHPVLVHDVADDHQLAIVRPEVHQRDGAHLNRARKRHGGGLRAEPVW